MPSTQHTPEPAVFRSEKGAINGVASLDSNGLVPNSQLPGATQSAAGTMSAADKTKLDGIATGATANVVSDSLSDTSTTNALSAAKGKALNDSITTLNTHMAQSALANGTDLNALIIPYNMMPVWYCGNDISQMQNIPSELIGNTWPFSIECFYTGNGSSGYARQILHVYATTDSPSNIFVRNQSYVSGRNWLGWEKLAIKSDLATQEALAEFTGTSSQSVSLPKSVDKYALLTVRVYNSNGEVCGVATAPPLFFKNLTYKIFGESSSQWGSFLLANDFASATFNRTSSNTQKVSVYGVVNV